MIEIAQQEFVSIAILAAISLLLNVYLYVSKSRIERVRNAYFGAETIGDEKEWRAL